MRRLAYDVRVEVEIPDDFVGDPELSLLMREGDDLLVRVGGGVVVHAEASAAPSSDERRDALEAAVALASERDGAAVIAELDALRADAARKKRKIRGISVERQDPPLLWGPDKQHAQKCFSLYDGGLPGPWMTKEEAATEIIRREQRKKFNLE